MRLLPRFSLRFAWIALTIFLIVFGAGTMYWRRMAQFNSSVETLIAAGYCVQETDDSRFGFVLGRDITEVIANPVNHPESDVTKIFLELPLCEELRGYTNTSCFEGFELPDALFAKLATCPKLTRLQLAGQDFSAEQLQAISQMRELKTLDLIVCTFPTAEHRYIVPLKKLEILRIQHWADKETAFAFQEFEKADFPELQFLLVGHAAASELRLTKQGFGRFPRLQFLSVAGCSFEKVLCEQGALPQLLALDLSNVDAQTEIDWDAVFAACPNLETLGIHVTQYNAAMNERLLRLPQLKLLRICPDYVKNFNQWESTLEFTDANRQLQVLKANIPDYHELVRQRPTLEICGVYARLEEYYLQFEHPYEYDPDVKLPSDGPTRWIERSLKSREIPWK